MKREKLSDNFYRYEFACKCGCGKDDISGLLVDDLQEIRDAIGQKIITNSGCRCRKHNKREGGKRYSSHCEGLATDIYSPGMMPEVLMDVIQCVIKDHCGIGVSQARRGKRGFVHLEWRTKNRRWVY